MSRACKNYSGVTCDRSCFIGPSCAEHERRLEAETERSRAAIPASFRQRMPERSDRPAIQDLVIADVEARKQEGLRKYGTLLQAFNGRDALLDAYQEALDQMVYLRQAYEEAVEQAFKIRELMENRHAARAVDDGDPDPARGG